MGYCYLSELGSIPYAQAWTLQKQLVQEVLENPAQDENYLLIAEHLPVYTLGTGSTLDHVKFDLADPRFEWHRIERGGEVTYHCPGQIVAYPILNLKHYCPDLHWYLRQLEEVVLVTLAQLGLKGERVTGLTGVWVNGYKVAAIGIKVRRWVTMHGLALNVCPDMAGFQEIVPCGIDDRPVGSLAQFLPNVRQDMAQQYLIDAFASVFQLTYVTHERRFEKLGKLSRDNL